MSDKVKKFVLLMRDRRGVTRPKRAKLYPDGSIVWNKRLYYYTHKALCWYPTKPNLYGLSTGLLPCHYVREENSLPLKMSEKELLAIKEPTGKADIIPESPYDFEGSEVAHKFKESNVVGGLATAARKSQQADMTQKYIVGGIAAILVSVIIGLAVIINGMGILKLW